MVACKIATRGKSGILARLVEAQPVPVRRRAEMASEFASEVTLIRITEAERYLG